MLIPRVRRLRQDSEGLTYEGNKSIFLLNSCPMSLKILICHARKNEIIKTIPRYFPLM
jgi:hypothetical protein